MGQSAALTQAAGSRGALWGRGTFPVSVWGAMAGPMVPLHDPAVLFRLLGPRFFSWVNVSDPDALGAFCQSKHPSPGALHVAPQGRKPGTKLPCKRKVKTARKFHSGIVFFSLVVSHSDQRAVVVDRDAPFGTVDSKWTHNHN